jgi:hypothetical protein
MERFTQLGDAAAGAVGAVGSAIAVGQGRGRQGAHSHVVLAATKGLLTLAGRVPLVGHLAAALQDLCIVYQVRPGAGNRGGASRADYLFTNSWPVGILTQGATGPASFAPWSDPSRLFAAGSDAKIP